MNIDQRIHALFRELDEVQQKAVLTTAAAMITGLDSIAALAAGNIVLATAGYPPTAVYILENEDIGSEVKDTVILCRRAK